MILREHVPCRAPLAGLTLIGLLGIAVLPGWTKGQAPLSDDALGKAESAADVAAPETRDAADPSPAIETRAEPAASPRGPSSEESPSLDVSSDADPRPATAREDRPRNERGAEPENAAPQDHAFPIRNRRPLGLPMQQADRHAAQIQQLERQLAELTAAVQALRNDGRLPEDAPHDPNRRANVDSIAARPRETETISPNLPVVRMELKQPAREMRVRVLAPALVRLPLHDGFKLMRIDIDKPEVLRLAEQSPHEVVLVAVHAGVATVKLWNNQDQVYTLHADVIQARGAELASEADAHRPVRVTKIYAAPRPPANIPAGGEVVETLTRVKYKLSAGKAPALAAFLEQYGNDGVESKVENETLTITASADAQARIGQFIQWLEPAPQRQEPPGPRQRSSNANDPFSPPAVVATPTPATTPGVDLGVLPPATPAPATPPPLGVDRAKPGSGEATPTP